MGERKSGWPRKAAYMPLLHQMVELCADLDVQGPSPRRWWSQRVALGVISKSSDETVRRVQPSSAVRRLRERWDECGDDLVLAIRERRARARAATAAPVGRGRIGYSIERLAGLPTNLAVEEVRREITAPWPRLEDMASSRAAEQLRTHPASRVREAVEMRQRLGLTPVVVEARRQADRLAEVRRFLHGC